MDESYKVRVVLFKSRAHVGKELFLNVTLHWHYCFEIKYRYLQWNNFQFKKSNFTNPLICWPMKVLSWFMQIMKDWNYFSSSINNVWDHFFYVKIMLTFKTVVTWHRMESWPHYLTHIREIEFAIDFFKYKYVKDVNGQCARERRAIATAFLHIWSSGNASLR